MFFILLLYARLCKAHKTLEISVEFFFLVFQINLSKLNSSSNLYKFSKMLLESLNGRSNHLENPYHANCVFLKGNVSSDFLFLN